MAIDFVKLNILDAYRLFMNVEQLEAGRLVQHLVQRLVALDVEDEIAGPMLREAIRFHENSVAKGKKTAEKKARLSSTASSTASTTPNHSHSHSHIDTENTDPLYSPILAPHPPAPAPDHIAGVGKMVPASAQLSSNPCQLPEPPRDAPDTLPGIETPPETPKVQRAPKAPQTDPLTELHALAAYHQTARDKIQRNHPSAKLPVKDSPGWYAERSVLEQLYRLDEYPEDTIIKTLEWVFDDAPRNNGFSWTDQVASLCALRQKKPGDTLTKFDKINASRNRPSQDKPRPIAKAPRRASDYDENGKIII